MERLISEVERLPKMKKLLKVAAYARVSRDKQEALNSLSAQVSHYNSLICSNSDWIFAGIYSDYAFSGTKDNRPEFNKMIDDKKTFIVWINSKDSVDYFRIIDSAEEIIKNNNIPYFYTYEYDSGIDTAFLESNIDVDTLDYGVVAIVKDGKIYNVLRRDYDSIKSDNETKTWLKKFIDLN